MKLIAGLMCTTHFSLLMGHFLGQPNEALLALKDLQPNRPDKATYLANHKRNWAVAVDPAVSLSTYSTLPMEVIP